MQARGTRVALVHQVHVYRRELRIIIFHHKSPIAEIFAQHLILSPAENFLSLR